MIDPRRATALVGAPVFTSERAYLGTIDGVTQDGPGITPRWAHLRHDTGTTVVPLAQAQLHTWGVELPFPADLVRGAPVIPTEMPTEADFDALSVHYGRHDAPPPPPSPVTSPGAARELVLSAERAQVRIETVPVERVRLRRVVVTEERTITVTVRKEVLELERTPLPDAVSADAVLADVGAQPTGRVGSEQDDVVVVLREERPVVSLEVVPVERVTLRRSTVTTEQTLTADLRSEQVDLTAP